MADILHTAHFLADLHSLYGCRGEVSRLVWCRHAEGSVAQAMQCLPVSQSRPVKWRSHLHLPWSISYFPWPEQFWLQTYDILITSCWLQFQPEKPLKQRHWSRIQTPLPEQLGSRQSTSQSETREKPGAQYRGLTTEQTKEKRQQIYTMLWL